MRRMRVRNKDIGTIPFGLVFQWPGFRNFATTRTDSSQDMTSPTSQQPLFIVGTGRCGSTMLSRMLALHPEIAGLSDVFSSLAPSAFQRDPIDGPHFWRLLSTPRANHRLWLQLLERGVAIDGFRYPISSVGRYRESGIPPLLMMTLSDVSSEPELLHEALREFVEPLPSASIGSQYVRIFDWLTARLQKRIWVERSGASLAFLDAMIALFPDAKFVHIWRDGREMAFSAARFPPMRLSVVSRDFQAAVGKTLYDTMTSQEIAKLPEHYRPLVANHFDVEAYTRLSLPIERFGQTWSNMICRALPLLADLPPHRVLHLRYESIQEKPEEELRKLITFIDPTLEREAWVKQAKDLMRPNPLKWPSLLNHERARLEKACTLGFAMLASQSLI